MHFIQDFHGGEFVFEAAGGGAAVEPRAGRVVAFSSDAENPHKAGPTTGGAVFGRFGGRTRWNKRWKKMPKVGKNDEQL